MIKTYHVRDADGGFVEIYDYFSNASKFVKESGGVGWCIHTIVHTFAAPFCSLTRTLKRDRTFSVKRRVDE